MENNVRVRVSASSPNWLFWGGMTSPDSNEMSGEWTPPTGPAHPDPTIPAAPGTAPTTPATSPPAPAAVPETVPLAGQPDGDPESPQSLSPPAAGAHSTIVLDDPQTRPRSKAPLIIIGALVLLAMFLFLADWTARNIETLQLLRQIEKSEAAMLETQEATIEVARSAPEGTFPLPPGKDLPPDVASDLEEISATGQDAVAAAGQDVAAVSFFPWHSDLIAAQASYLEHNLAWVNHLEAGSEDGEVLVRGDDADIESTWRTAEVQIRAAVPLVPFPGIPERVDTIFEEETDENSGPTLQVSGPNEVSGPKSRSGSSRRDPQIHAHEATFPAHERPGDRSDLNRGRRIGF